MSLIKVSLINHTVCTEIGMQKRTLPLPLPSLPPSLPFSHFLPTFTAGLGERDSRKNPVSGTTHLPSFHRLGWVVRLTERPGSATLTSSIRNEKENEIALPPPSQLPRPLFAPFSGFKNSATHFRLLLLLRTEFQLRAGRIEFHRRITGVA